MVIISARFGEKSLFKTFYDFLLEASLAIVAKREQENAKRPSLSVLRNLHNFLSSTFHSLNAITDLAFPTISPLDSSPMLSTVVTSREF